MLVTGNLVFKRNHSDLTIQQLQKITAFFLFLIKQKSINRASLIYRGDNFENLKSKLNLHGDQIEDTNLNEMLFLIGEKGRGYRKSYTAKIKKKYKIFGIKNSEERVFKYIFGKYRAIFKKENTTLIENFKRSNPLYAEYFLSGDNENVFLETVGTLLENERLEIRDYFLSPLHHLGAIGYFNNSIFLSTSSDSDIASDFSPDRQLPNFSEKITIVSWIPRPLMRRDVAHRYSSILNKTIKKLGFPVYKASFYPAQKEITMKGGLFPHYILGYFRGRKNHFEINPHFFSTEKTFNEILDEGFNIDQSNFHRRLKETDYDAFFWAYDNGIYGDSI
jgi:hypothetical protein